MSVGSWFAFVDWAMFGYKGWVSGIYIALAEVASAKQNNVAGVAFKNGAEKTMDIFDDIALIEKGIKI